MSSVNDAVMRQREGSGGKTPKRRSDIPAPRRVARRPRFSSPAQPFWVRIPLRLYEGLASLKLAVFVIITLAVLLAWATQVDSRYGHKAAQFAIYGTWWFAAVLTLLGLNVLCAALIRFPWRRYQTGFVITHSGILVLLAGCLLTRLGWVDAQMPVLEGGQSHRAFQDTQRFELTVTEPSGQSSTIAVPFGSGPLNWAEYDQGFFFPWGLTRIDRGVIYDRDGIRLEVLDYYADSELVASGPSKGKIRMVPFDFQKEKEQRGERTQRRVRVRLSVDGKSEDFWLEGVEKLPLDLPPTENEIRSVAAERRTVQVKLLWDTFDLGFDVYLHQFNRKLDPGSSMASHYSSLVEFRDRRDGRRVLRDNVLVTLNEPVDFVDPGPRRTYRLFQESFLGPYKPGERLFDGWVTPGSRRDQLFISTLTVNYDPGRGLKYLGCLLVVAGVVTMFYMKAYFFKRRGDA